MEGQCGWLKDKYGLGWQVFPSELTEIMNIKDSAALKRKTEKMFQMKKIIINDLLNA